eukprot:gene18346-25837_t
MARNGRSRCSGIPIGDERPGRDLRDTLRAQLVTKYMAPEVCRSGCLLVTVSKTRKWDHPDSGERLDLVGLEAMLQAEASQIMNEMGGELLLVARVLDLRPRAASAPGLDVMNVFIFSVAQATSFHFPWHTRTTVVTWKLENPFGINAPFFTFSVTRQSLLRVHTAVAPAKSMAADGFAHLIRVGCSPSFDDRASPQKFVALRSSRLRG